MGNLTSSTFSSPTVHGQQQMSVKTIVDVSVLFNFLPFLFDAHGYRCRYGSQAAIADNTVALFSKSYCPYCRRAKSLFQSQFPNVPVKVYEYVCGVPPLHLVLKFIHLYLRVGSTRGKMGMQFRATFGR